ncbi:hypothetical protein ACQR1W_28145 [Bradyrhizobium sp. HKCCYLS1011]|uniref:hypothetical protein n=1 Tax=Bradyrhizobium sp. HKCCYLS1011 TaxID=3420733 RepID=UPI003EB7C986
MYARSARKPALLYEPPFTGIATIGPEHLFAESKVVKLFETIKASNESAVVREYFEGATRIGGVSFDLGCGFNNAQL